MIVITGARMVHAQPSRRNRDKWRVGAMQIKKIEYTGLAEKVVILDDADAQKAIARIASFHAVPLEVVRNELAAGLRVSTCCAYYEAT